MRLLDRLAARKAAFYFVFREEVALNGGRELVASLAQWFTPGDPFAELPDALPVWHGSYLRHDEAFDRWAFPDIWVVVVGCPDARCRRALVAHIRSAPPIGMFDLDADADSLRLPLVLSGFVLPQAAIRLNEFGRRVDRETGLDVIGFASEEEMLSFDYALAPGDEEDDLLGHYLLRLLSRGAGRPLRGIQAADGFEALIDQAYELSGLGAVGAAGCVAGVAFEQLMRAALQGKDLVWLEKRTLAGQHTQLNDVIAKVASAGGWDDGRLHRYRRLRNDLAHRLGDEAAFPRDEGELKQSVDDFLNWLAKQRINDHGVAILTDVPPKPDLDYKSLLAAALKAAEAAAATARTTPITVVPGEQFEPIGFAWVIVRDEDRPFTRWLLESGNASPTSGGARLNAPHMSLERNLAWAHACAMCFRDAGHPADYAGRPD